VLVVLWLVLSGAEWWCTVWMAGSGGWQAGSAGWQAPADDTHPTPHTTNLEDLQEEMCSSTDAALLEGVMLDVGGAGCVGRELPQAAEEGPLLLPNSCVHCPAHMWLSGLGVHPSLPFGVLGVAGCAADACRFMLRLYKPIKKVVGRSAAAGPP
jgi:hypothetical protein